MREKIFIYGLFRDQAKDLLKDFKSLGIHSVRGKIFKVNEFYPGWTQGEGKVFGELVEVDEFVTKFSKKYKNNDLRVDVKLTDTECLIYLYRKLH